MTRRTPRSPLFTHTTLFHSQAEDGIQEHTSELQSPCNLVCRLLLEKKNEIEAGKSYCSRRFGGATCDDKSAQIYARFGKNDWRIKPEEFYRFHDAEVNTFGYF